MPDPHDEPARTREEDVARIICAAGGNDPDADWALPYPNNPNPSCEPAWMSFEAEARAVLAYFDRLALTQETTHDPR